MGSLEGKTILLLGNGLSVWELNFLDLGAKILFTDLTLSACERMREVLLASRYRDHLAAGNIEFHATDARHLPFPAGSIDVIYGRNFLHHVRETEALLKELGSTADPGIRDRYADLYARSQVLRYTGLRIQTALSRGQMPGSEGSIL